MVWGSVMNGVSGWLRYISATEWINDAEWSPVWLPYAILVSGQCVAALAQPVFTNAPTALSAEWFATEERDVATTVAALFNLIGNAAGQVIPPMIVRDDNDTPDTCGMAALLLVQAGIATFGCILTTGLYRDCPPNVFPSRIALKKARDLERSRLEGHRTAPVPEEEELDGMTAALKTDGASDLAMTEVIKLWMKLLQDKEFLKLMIGFGTGLAIFNSLMTVIQQVITPAGYSSDDAGTLGGILIGSGLVGAMIVGPVLDATKAYKPMLRTGMPIGLVAVVAFVVSLKPGNMTNLAIAIGGLGFVMIPMLPVSLETAAGKT